MLSLKQALLEHHLIILQMLGEWFELELFGKDKEECATEIAEAFTKVDMEQEIKFLQPEEQAALVALVNAGGRLPVPVFARDYGEIRQMGPARLEREEPWFSPENSAEALWYRGFMYRSFAETDDGLIEYYFIPDELVTGLAQIAPPKAREEPTPFTPDKPAHTAPTNQQFTPTHTRAVDDLTTILALAQTDRFDEKNLDSLNPFLTRTDRSWRLLLLRIAADANLMKRGDTGIRPTRAAVDWLQKPREEQLRTLITAWQNGGWNELRHVPDLICEGNNWSNDPKLARQALFDALPRTTNPATIDSILNIIKTTIPDFQRPDGDYNTWYIRDRKTGEFLAGFEQWDAVEGRLLRYLLTDVLHHLGLVDVSDNAIRMTPRAIAWLNDNAFSAPETPIPVIIQPDATLIISEQVNRFQRFQAMRIAEPQPVAEGGSYLLRITPSSLKMAREQGIKPDRVLKFLGSVNGGMSLPAGVKRAVERWSEHGTEGRIEHAVILRVGDEAVMQTLRTNAKTRDLLGEPLSDLAIVVRPGQWDTLRRATAQLGLFLDVDGSLIDE